MVLLLILKIYPILAIIAAIVVGLYCKYRQNKGSWESYQIATAVFVVFVILYLSIPIFVPYSVSQDQINIFTIMSLILALLAITMNNLKDIGTDHNFRDLNSNVETIQDRIHEIEQNIQLILNHIARSENLLNELMQQNQIQTEITSESEASDENDE